MDPTLNNAETLVQSYAKATSESFNGIADSLIAFDSKRTLAALNDAVSLGPAFQLYRSVRESRTDQQSEYFDLVEEEIRRLADIPNQLDTCNARSHAETECQRFVRPGAEVELTSDARVRVLLEASTDCRLAPFSRIVSYVVGDNQRSISDWEQPATQRLLGFAMWTAASRKLPVKSFDLLAGLSDPPAILAGIAALQAALASGIIGDGAYLDYFVSLMRC